MPRLRGSRLYEQNFGINLLQLAMLRHRLNSQSAPWTFISRRRPWRAIYLKWVGKLMTNTLQIEQTF